MQSAADIKITGGTNTFKNNEASNSGGAIQNAGTAKVEIIGGKNTFEKNEAIIANGGAIWTGAVTINVDGVNSTANFTGNKAGGSGGAISLNNNSGTSIITGATFATNEALTGGGAIRAVGDTTISNSTFTGNKVTRSTGTSGGGAIFVAGNTGASLAVDNSTFTSNTSGQYGGAIYIAAVAGGSITITDSSFHDNNAALNGGAIHSRRDLTIEAKEVDVIFSGNTTGAAGSEVASDIDIYTNVTATFDAAAGKTITLGGGITNTANTTGGKVTKTGAGTLVFANGSISNYEGDTSIDAGTLQVVDTGTLTIKGATSYVADGAMLNSGMYFDGTDWNSNIITDGTGTIDFKTGSTWYITEAAGYRGEAIEGTITADFDEANAALKLGNEFTQVYDFSYNDGTSLVEVGGKKKANVNDIIVNAPLMFAPNAMGTAVAGRVQQQFALVTNRNGVYRGQECDPCAPVCGKPAVSSLSVWTNYIGRSTELESSSAIASLAGKSKITSDGVQAGADRLIGKRTVVGAMFNYERALSVLNASRMTGDNYGFAFYGAHQFRTGIDALAMFGYGRQNYESRRVDLAGDLNTAKFNGNTFEMTLEAGRRFRMNQNLWLRPAIALDVYNNGIESFSERELSGLDFGQMSLTQAFVRVGGDAIVKRGRFVGNGGFYYSHQMSKNGDRVSTSVNNISGVLGSDLGRNKLTFNLGGSYALGERKALTAFGGYSGDYFTDRAGTPWGHNGYVGVRYQF